MKTFYYYPTPAGVTEVYTKAQVQAMPQSAVKGLYALALTGWQMERVQRAIDDARREQAATQVCEEADRKARYARAYTLPSTLSGTFRVFVFTSPKPDVTVVESRLSGELFAAVAFVSRATVRRFHADREDPYVAREEAFKKWLREGGFARAEQARYLSAYYAEVAKEHD